MSVDASAWGLNVVSLSPGDFPPNLRFPVPLISIFLCLALPHPVFAAQAATFATLRDKREVFSPPFSSPISLPWPASGDTIIVLILTKQHLLL